MRTLTTSMRRATLALFFTIAITASAFAQEQITQQAATYQVERSWPDYFLEHKQYFEPRTYKIEGAPARVVARVA